MYRGEVHEIFLAIMYHHKVNLCHAFDEGYLLLKTFTCLESFFSFQGSKVNHLPVCQGVCCLYALGCLLIVVLLDVLLSL